MSGICMGVNDAASDGAAIEAFDAICLPPFIPFERLQKRYSNQ